MATKMDNTVNVNEVSRVSAGTHVKGEIKCDSDIRIDGNVEGTVTSKGRVVVGEKATINGDIFCESVEFYGTITGNFYVKETLSLKAGCKVEGNLNVKRLQIEVDAHFNGTCKMIDNAAVPSPSPSPASASAQAPADKAAPEK